MIYVFMAIAAVCYVAAIHSAYLLSSARRDREAALSRLRCLRNSALCLLEAPRHSEAVRGLAESAVRFDAAHALALLQDAGNEERAVREMRTIVSTNAEIARLERALRDCITREGDMAWNSHDLAKRRLHAINAAAEEVPERGEDGGERPKP